ncbi:hypothetical protein CPAR01_10423 [Colletotrichum paranaense]|uniref:Uncharacterized protein n=1 Tax=Colletotrichum paranaense TaxID=1914294 RepID=A0ABQ9SDX9_9PEZI|nr:uncharacterized protein CPAR01_10423 [Colletotrichum paranaense]KAK1533715.1 hypothetical protein CPAR01_10423 [Colletotrichum paranaense]
MPQGGRVRHSQPQNHTPLEPPAQSQLPSNDIPSPPPICRRHGARIASNSPTIGLIVGFKGSAQASHVPSGAKRPQSAASAVRSALLVKSSGRKGGMEEERVERRFCDRSHSTLIRGIGPNVAGLGCP